MYFLILFNHNFTYVYAPTHTHTKVLFLLFIGSDRGSTETAEDGPLEDEGRSRRSLDNRLRSAHHYEPNTNSLDLSDPSGTGDTLSVDTTNTNLSTETTSSSPLHRHLDGTS